MKYIFTLILCLVSFQQADAQSLSLFNVDASNFPTIKAKFYAFDAVGNQVRPSASEFTLTESGQPRTITSVTCPPPQPPVAISSVLTVDVSGSMSSGPAGVSNLDLAKAAARAWIQGLPAGQSECALSSFDDNNYLHQDFTTDRSRLLSMLSTLSPNGGTDYDKGLIQPFAGSLQISQRGNYKRVVVFLSDGLPNSEPNTAAIIAEAKRQNCMIFAVTLGMQCPQSLKDISSQTGAQWYENVTTTPEAEEVYRKIMQVAVGSDPCEIAWTSGATCQKGYVNVELAWNGQKSLARYSSPINSVANLSFSPSYIFCRNKPVGLQFDTTIIITANNSAFNVLNIISNNPAFDANPKKITLNAGQSQILKVSYTPADSGFAWAKFDIQTDVCPQLFYAEGGFIGKKPTQKILKLTYPNGGETFVAGNDTLITWEGIAKSETVELEYSIDNGNSWKSITTSASNLQYIWKNIPKPASNQCKVRVKQNSGGTSGTQGTVQVTLGGHTNSVYSVSWSPDGTKVATGSYDYSAIIWSVVSGAKLLTLNGHTSYVTSVSWSPDGTKVATGSWDTTARIWSAMSGATLLTLNGHTEGVTSVSWSPDGTKVATGSWDTTARIWSAVGGATLLTISGYTSPVTSVSWSPDGTKVATASWDRTAKISSAVSGATLLTLNGHTNAVTSVSWSPDGTKVATGSYDSTARIWSAVSGSTLLTLRGHTAVVSSVSWSPDGTKVATASWDKTTKIWSAVSGATLLTLNGHTSPVYSVSWSSDGTKVATGSFDHSAIIWSAVSGAKLLTLSGHTAPVYSVSWSPDGTKVATGSYEYDNTAKIWSAVSGATLLTLSGHTKGVTSVSWSPDGTKVATGSFDNTAKIWSAVSGSTLLTLNGHTSQVTSVSWSPDGTKVATGSWDKTTKIWSAVSGATLLTLSGHTAGVTSVSWSPDGTKVATGCLDYSAIIWSAVSGAKLLTLSGHTEAVSSISWSPDGTKVATGSYDSTARIWSAVSGATLLTLNGHTNTVTSVSWSPDGTKVATGSWDTTGRIWTAVSGATLLTLSGHTSLVSSVNWSPDGTKVATGSWDNTAKIWFVDTPTLQEDESDSVFRIVEAQAMARNIDMRQCLVGSVKDSLITTFISNTGSYKCRVDSIYLTGSDASVFSLVSGIPRYEIAVGLTKATEFRFIPKRIGIHSATINILTQSDTLQQTIVGEGITPELQVLGDVIDFGAVEVGSLKDTLRVITIKNIGTAPLTITSTRHAGPNDVNFSTLSGGGNFTLAQGDTARFDLRFSPKDIGRTSGRLLFEYNGVGSPATVQLFGEGTSNRSDTARMTVVVQDITAQAGEKVNLILKIEKQTGMHIAGAPTDWYASVHYNKSMLFNEQSQNVCTGTEDSCVLELTGTYNPKTDELISIPCIATLGTTDNSMIIIDDFRWLNSSIITETQTQNGKITITGACEEGGVRLYIPGTQETSLTTRPNPAQNSLQIQYGVREPLTLTLELLSMTGQVVQTIFRDQQKTVGQYLLTSDLSTIGNGIYILRLTSNRGVLTTRVDVVK